MTRFVLVSSLALFTMACEPAEPVDVAVTVVGSGVSGATVTLYADSIDWEDEVDAVSSIVVDESGVAVFEQLAPSDSYWVDVRNGDYAANWSNNLFPELNVREDADGIEIELLQGAPSVFAEAGGRTWEVVASAPFNGGTPSQEVLDCHVGTTLTFSKGLGSGDATVVAPPGCTLFDYSGLTTWRPADDVGAFWVVGDNSEYALSLSGWSLSGDTITAWTQSDTDGDGLGNADSNASLTLERVE